MKKYVTGLVAVMLAVSAVALPKLSGNNTNYYWYKRSGPNNYVADGFGANPTVTCSGSAKICAKGFLQTQVADDVKDATIADDQRTKD